MSMRSYSTIIDENVEQQGANNENHLQEKDGFVQHVKDKTGYKPMPAIPKQPVEFENDNFTGRCVFIHRPVWSYDDGGGCKKDWDYPYKKHFDGRLRLWELRLQGRFKRRPGRLFAGIELEHYIPVNRATRIAMRALLGFGRGLLGCDAVHEFGA